MTILINNDKRMKNEKYNAPPERDGLLEFVCYRYNAALQRN
jgi:hypothetical protein